MSKRQPELFKAPKNIGRGTSKDKRVLDPKMTKALRDRAQVGTARCAVRSPSAKPAPFNAGGEDDDEHDYIEALARRNQQNH